MEPCKAFQFRTPTSLLIAGLSGCGKTVFTTQLLLDDPELFDKFPKPIHYCYGSWQKGFRETSNSTKGSQSQSLPKWFPEGGVLVLDDLIDEGSNDKCILNLFTKDSHQDLFPNEKFAKTISRITL